MLVLMKIKILMHLPMLPSIHKGNSLAILDLILKNIFLDLKIYELENLQFCSASLLKDSPKDLVRFTQDLFKSISKDLQICSASLLKDSPKDLVRFTQDLFRNIFEDFPY
jgi:superfamily II RNA helicase